MGSLAARWVLDALDKKIEAKKFAGKTAESTDSEPDAEKPSASLGTLHLLPAELVIRESTAPLRA